MQTALHITSLVAELSQEVVGARIVSTEFYKKQRAAFIFLKAEKKRWALGLVYHPAGSGCYLVPASKVRIETREKPWPFFELEGGHVEAVAQLGVDRIFELRVAQSNETKRVVYECLGPNGNLWLLDSEGVRRATLRKRELSDERPYAPPPSDRLDPFALTGEQLARFDEEYPDTPLVRLL